MMEHVLYPQPGYPFSLGISIEYALSDTRTPGADNGHEPRHGPVSLRERRSSVPDRSGPQLSISLMLRVPGRTVLRSDERGLPIGAEAVRARNTIFGSRGRSARQRSTMRSPTLSGTRMASLVSSSEIRTTGLKSRSGSTRATRT